MANRKHQLQNIRVSAHDIGSSMAALHVVQLDSTGGIISGGAGGGSTQVSVRDVLTSSGASVMDSTNNAVGVTIRAGSAAGTEYTDGDVDASISGGAILFDNSSNTLRPVTLTRGLPVNVVAGVATQSTTVNVSSLAGAVIVRSSAANALVSVYQSTAADLNVTALVSSVAGFVDVTPGAPSAGDYLPVRITDGSSFISPGLEYTDGSTASSLAGPAVMFNNSSNNTMRMVGVLQPLPAQFRTSSGADMADSTNTALRVNVVAGAAGGSTVVTVSTGSVRVHQSTAADLNVTVAGYSTTVNVSSLGGAVIVRSSAANALVSVYQSTAADLNVTALVSSVAGFVDVTPGAPSASDYLPVRITDGSSFISPGLEYTDGSTYSSLAGPAVMFNNSSNNTLRMAGLTTPFPVQVTDSSNAAVKPGDSANNAIRVNVVAGAAGGSTVVTVSTGSVRVHQSTYTDLNALSRIADRDQSTQTANVTNTTPASTAYGLVVREAVAQSTGPFSISSIVGPVTVRSSAANLLASVYQSTAADLNVTVAGYSTTVNVSSLGGAVIVRSSAANFLASAYQSTYTDFNGLMRIADRDQSTQVAVVTNTTPASTAYAIVTRQAGVASMVPVDSSVVVIGASTSTPAQGANGLNVRQVHPTINSTTLLITSTHSTAIYPLISSAAGLRHKVFAYFVGSTHANPSTLIFCSSASASGFDHWHVNFGSGSSGVTGANLVVNPPAFLFGGVSANALNVKVEGGSSVTSTTIVRVSISWFDEA